MERKKMEKIVKKWTDKVFASYPVKPVVEVVEYVENAAGRILDGMIAAYQGGKKVDVDDAIDDLMRFLATDRNLKPGDSMALLFELRNMVAEEMKLKGEDRLEFDRRVEDIILKGFNYYIACREKIFELRLKEKDMNLEMMRKIIEYSQLDQTRLKS